MHKAGFFKESNDCDIFCYKNDYGLLPHNRDPNLIVVRYDPIMHVVAVCLTVEARDAALRLLKL